MSNENKTSIGEVLCDVRKSFRILTLFSERVCKLIQYIGNRMGLEYCGDKSLAEREDWWPPLVLRKDYQRNLEKSPFAWLPMYYRAFRLRMNTPHIEVRVIVWPDTGSWDMEEGSTNVKDFPDVSRSSSRLVFVIANESALAELDGDLADRWEKAAPENSGEFPLPVSEKSDKKAFYKVFDLAEFENKEATDKALQAFVDYANQNGFALKLKSDTEDGET
jgi:hypothetical protein